MVRTLHLPFRAVEGTSVVVPFFWCAFDQDDDNPHLQVVFRKSDVRKRGLTRGWELMLSHEFRSGITTGYAKGTESSDVVEAIKHLRACAAQVAHPLLLPVIVLSHDLSAKNDQKQRDARDWLRRLEHAVSMRSESADGEGYVRDAVFDLDQINRDLVECHSQVLWKRPQAYLEILRTMERAMLKFKFKLPRDRETAAVDQLHRSMLSRLEFYRAKLKGIENYAFTTLARLDIQRGAVRVFLLTPSASSNCYSRAQQKQAVTNTCNDCTSSTTSSPRKSPNSTSRWPASSGGWPTPPSATARP